MARWVGVMEEESVEMRGKVREKEELGGGGRRPWSVGLGDV